MAREDSLEFEEVALFGWGELAVFEDTCDVFSLWIVALASWYLLRGFVGGFSGFGSSFSIGTAASSEPWVGLSSTGLE
jgi:hypothetical protein